MPRKKAATEKEKIPRLAGDELKKAALIQNCIALQAAMLEKDNVIHHLSHKKPVKRVFPSSAELSTMDIDALSEYFLDIKRTYDKLDAEQSAIVDRISIGTKVDGLTGLYKQKYFGELLRAEIERSYWGIKNQIRIRGVSLIFIDLDDFKKFNTFYGHLSGNKVLEIMAKAILATIRPSDMAARFGGDEFVIMLPETDKHGALIVANNVLNNLKLIGLSASMGISEYNPKENILLPLDIESESQRIMSKADKAMYNVKSTGKNKVLVH